MVHTPCAETSECVRAPDLPPRAAKPVPPIIRWAHMRSIVLVILCSLFCLALTLGMLD